MFNGLSTPAHGELDSPNFLNGLRFYYNALTEIKYLTFICNSKYNNLA